MKRIRMASRQWVLLAVAMCAITVGSVALAAQRDSGASGRRGPVVEVDLRAPSVMPTLPAAATRPTEDGATAFALFWFDALNYSLAHYDTDLLVSYTGAGCRQCTGWLIAIHRWKSDRAKLAGGLTAPIDLAIGPFSTVEPVQFAVTFLTTPATVTQADGAEENYPGGRTRGVLTVLWSHGRWQVTDVVLDVGRAGQQP